MSEEREVYVPIEVELLDDNGNIIKPPYTYYLRWQLKPAEEIPFTYVEIEK